MFFELFKVLVPLVSFLFNVLCQIFSMRTPRNFGLLNSVFFSFFFGVLMLCGFEYYLIAAHPRGFEEMLASFFVHLMTYMSLSYCYFHFINLGETARRIRILRELKDTQDGLSLGEILSRYNAGEIVERRLSRLVKNDQIVLKNGRYYIGKPFVLGMAKLLMVLKCVLLGRKE